MSLGYEINEQTLSGIIDIYADHIDTQTLTVGGVDITGQVVGPTGAIGPAGPVAPQIRLYDEVISTIPTSTLTSSDVGFVFTGFATGANDNLNFYNNAARWDIPQTMNATITFSFQVSAAASLQTTLPTDTATFTLNNIYLSIYKNEVFYQDLPTEIFNITKTITFSGVVDPITGFYSITPFQSYGNISRAFTVSPNGGTATDRYTCRISGSSSCDRNGFGFCSIVTTSPNRMDTFTVSKGSSISVVFNNASISYVAPNCSVVGTNQYPTGTVAVNNLISTGDIYYKGELLNSVGPAGPAGPQGPQGPQGDAADTSAVQAQVVVLDALVAGLGVTTVALGTTVAGLSTAVTTVQGEVGVLGGKVSTLENQTKFVSSTTKTIVNSDLVITNGVSNTIELTTDGTVNCVTENSTTVNTTVVNATDIVNCPEIQTTNIVPYTSPLGVLNIATGGVLKTINIGNTTSIVNIDGNVFFNRSLGVDTFNLGGFLNQLI